MGAIVPYSLPDSQCQFRAIIYARLLTVQFGVSNLPGLSADGLARWVGQPDHHATVWLGNPLLEWTIPSIVDKGWLQSAYDLMKRFLALVRRELELLSFGQWSELNWSTNDKDSIRSSLLMGKGNADGLPSVVERCMPGLQALLMLATSMPEQRGNSLLFSLITLVATLRDLGASIDAENFFVNLGAAVLARSASREADKPQAD